MCILLLWDFELSRTIYQSFKLMSVNQSILLASLPTAPDVTISLKQWNCRSGEIQAPDFNVEIKGKQIYSM